MHRVVLAPSVFLTFAVCAAGCSDSSGDTRDTDSSTTAVMTTTTMPTTTETMGMETVDPSDTEATGGSESDSDPSAGPECGNGEVEGDEACDDGNDVNTDECLNSCELAVCGDGTLHEGVEECDDGNDDNTDACLDTCVAASCGDGFVGPGESCDDGNTNDDDECTNSCALASCGDGVLQAGEDCDDGNADNSDACLDTCVAAMCGDGFVYEGEEECDDGNFENTDDCVAGCVAATCGDGYVHEGSEEQCDDENDDNTDSCTNDCFNAACGDGFLQPDEGEICDDGNQDDGDGCQADCTITEGAKSVGIGWYHSCAVSFAGEVYCWGRNNYGQLGHGTTTQIGDNELPNSVGPVDLGGVAESVVAGEYHTCALMEGGEVRCWGRSNRGQLGYGTTNSVGDNEAPSTAGVVQVGGTVTQLTAGSNHTCALLDDGNVRCWGYGVYGRLGYNNTNNIGDNELPQNAGNVTLGATATQVAAGELHTCALTDANEIRCWGYGSNGQLGYGNTQAIGDNEFPSTAGSVNMGANATFVAAGRRHTCVITDGNNVRCWGLNSNGQLGYGHTTQIGDNEQPNVSGDINLGGDEIVELALGYNSSCARVSGGDVRCWGNSTYGQLGQGNNAQIGDNEQPNVIQPIDVGGAVTQISANWYHVCARLESSQIRCWGRGNYGQLGYGNTQTIGDNEIPASVSDVPFL